MPRLGLPGLIMAGFIAANMKLVSVYVPGQYKDGIYIRPHFLPPETTFSHQEPLEAEKGTTTRMPPKPAVLDAKPPADKLPPDTPS